VLVGRVSRMASGWTARLRTAPGTTAPASPGGAGPEATEAEARAGSTVGWSSTRGGEGQFEAAGRDVDDEDDARPGPEG
jgi:hypothetical protein